MKNRGTRGPSPLKPVQPDDSPQAYCSECGLTYNPYRNGLGCPECGD